MTAEFVTDWCPIALLVEELDGSLKAGFPFRRFLCTHDSFTSIEQVHCHSYPTKTMIAFIFTQNNYINDLQSFWRTAPIQLWRTHKSSHEPCKRLIQMQTPRAFCRWCRSSEWSYLSGHQSTVAVAITYPTVLDSTSHSLLVVVTGFGSHALKQ